MNGLYSPAKILSKDELWKEYGYLVRWEALKLQARLPSGVETDDLVQAGAIAMMNAVAQFDPTVGVKLKVFLTQRIRWAFLDELREYDWAPRRVRRKSREVSAAIASVEQRTGGEATEMEIADEMGLTLQEYHTVLQETNTCQIYSLNELLDEPGEASELLELQIDELNPMHMILQHDLVVKISEEIKLLSEREQFILNLYYQQDLNMKEIGLILNLTETRISQLHSQTIKRLRARIEMRLGLTSV